MWRRTEGRRKKDKSDKNDQQRVAKRREKTVVETGGEDAGRHGQQKGTKRRRCRDDVSDVGWRMGGTAQQKSESEKRISCSCVCVFG